MIDFHCHIDLYDDPVQVLARAEEFGIYVLSVTTTPKAWVGTCDLSKQYKRVRTSLGLHPQLVEDRFHELDLFESLLPQTRYVGEIGLDKSKNHKNSYGLQLVVFKRIVELCVMAGGKIMSIHSNKAARDVLDVLETHPNAGPAVLHWFTGSLSQVERAAKLGCWFSVGSTMLKTDSGKARVRHMPIDRILLETDGPFTSDNSGAPLEPISTITLVGELAEILEISREAMQSIIENNFRHLTSSLYC